MSIEETSSHSNKYGIDIISNSIIIINDILKLQERSRKQNNFTYFDNEIELYKLQFNGRIDLKIESLKFLNTTNFIEILKFYVYSIAIDSITLDIINFISTNRAKDMYYQFPYNYKSAIGNVDPLCVSLLRQITFNKFTSEDANRYIHGFFFRNKK